MRLGFLLTAASIALATSLVAVTSATTALAYDIQPVAEPRDGGEWTLDQHVQYDIERNDQKMSEESVAKVTCPTDSAGNTVTIFANGKLQFPGFLAQNWTVKPVLWIDVFLDKQLMVVWENEKGERLMSPLSKAPKDVRESAYQTSVLARQCLADTMQ